MIFTKSFIDLYVIFDLPDQNPIVIPAPLLKLSGWEKKLVINTLCS